MDCRRYAHHYKTPLTSVDITKNTSHRSVHHCNTHLTSMHIINNTSHISVRHYKSPLTSVHIIGNTSHVSAHPEWRRVLGGGADGAAELLRDRREPEGHAGAHGAAGRGARPGGPRDRRGRARSQRLHLDERCPVQAELNSPQGAIQPLTNSSVPTHSHLKQT